MVKAFRTLDTLLPGESAYIGTLKCSDNIMRRMMELGIIPGILITALHVSPLGNPTAYQVLGAVIAIRDEDARGITITK